MKYIGQGKIANHSFINLEFNEIVEIWQYERGDENSLGEIILENDSLEYCLNYGSNGVDAMEDDFELSVFKFGQKLKFNDAHISLMFENSEILTSIEKKNKDYQNENLKIKYFCLIGFDYSAFALIDWTKKGQYGFDFYSGNVHSKMTASD